MAQISRASIRAGCLFPAVMMLFAGQTSPEPRDEIDHLVYEIRATITAEPIVAGVDTRLLLAELLRNRDHALAKELIAECVQVLTAIPNLDVVAQVGAKLVGTALVIDPDNAEAIARILPATRGSDGVSPREFAYDGIVDYWRSRDPKRAVNVLFAALDAGSFRLFSGSEILRSAAKRDIVQAREIFVRLLTAFPHDSAQAEDINFMLTCTDFIAGTSPALARQAIEELLVAAERESDAQDGTLVATYSVGSERAEFRGRRDATVFPIAAFLKVHHPDLYKENIERFAKAEKLLRQVTPDNVREAMTPIATVRTPRRADDDAAVELPGPGWLAFAERINQQRFADALVTIEQAPSRFMKAATLNELLQRKDASQDEQRQALRRLLAILPEVQPLPFRAQLLEHVMRQFATGPNSDLLNVALNQAAPFIQPLCRCGEPTEKTKACLNDHAAGALGCASLCMRIAVVMHGKHLQLDRTTFSSVAARWHLLRLRAMLPSEKAEPEFYSSWNEILE